MIYKIQQRIETLAQIAVPEESLRTHFELLGVSFSRWDLDDWKETYWLAQAQIEALNYKEAFQNFRVKLAKIIPRVSLISQCYIEFLAQPFLIHKRDASEAFFRFTYDRGGTGLMFMQNELTALIGLLENAQIPEEFFYYWYDAVNATGYSSKLLLMFSAIEALVKDTEGKKDRTKLELILGTDLKVALYGTKGNSSGGLRHRLVHGEYFNPNDSKKDYLYLVHNQIISYFNDSLFHEKLIHENVVNPQRHSFGNKEGSRFFIRATGGSALNLKDILSDIKENDIYNMKKYESVHDDALAANY